MPKKDEEQKDPKDALISWATTLLTNVDAPFEWANQTSMWRRSARDWLDNANETLKEKT